MNLLLDSHVLLWWLATPGRLSPRAADTVGDPSHRVYVSAATAWELSIKTSLGKLDADEVVTNFARILMEKGFRRLAISVDHAIRAGTLPAHHKDPFDRMLIAQAQALGFAIVSGDTTIDLYGIRRIW